MNKERSLCNKHEPGYIRNERKQSTFKHQGRANFFDLKEEHRQRLLKLVTHEIRQRLLPAKHEPGFIKTLRTRRKFVNKNDFWRSYSKRYDLPDNQAIKIEATARRRKGK